MSLRTTCLALLLLALPCVALQARPQPGPGTQQSQLRADDGHVLALWSRMPAQPRGTILLVHGRTWSSLPNFDLQVPGEAADSRSVLAALARAGDAAYALDLRGYGATPRDRDGWNTPARAMADVEQTLAWIAARHPALPPPALLGYSNGARIALMVAQARPKALSGLVLYGFPNDVDAPDPAQPPPTGPPPRERTSAEAAASDFVTAGAAGPAVREAYVAQALAADPVRPTGAHPSSSRSTPSRSPACRSCCCAGSTIRWPRRPRTHTSMSGWAARTAAGSRCRRPTTWPMWKTRTRPGSRPWSISCSGRAERSAERRQLMRRCALALEGHDPQADTRASGARSARQPITPWMYRVPSTRGYRATARASH